MSHLQRAGGRFGKQSPWRRFERRLSGKCSRIVTPDTVVASSRRQDTCCWALLSQFLIHKVWSWGPRISLLIMCSWPGLGNCCPWIDIKRVKHTHCLSKLRLAVQSTGLEKEMGAELFLGLVSKHLMGSKADLWIQPPILVVPLACWPIYVLHWRNPRL